MGDEFKNSLDGFISNIVLKIGDKSIVDEVQKAYEDLIDHYCKLTVMTKEEFEAFDIEFANYDKQIEQLTKDNTDLKTALSTQKDSYDQRIALLSKEIDNKEAIQKSVDSLSQMNSSMQNKLKGYQNENVELSLKIKTMTGTIDDLKQENKKLSNENFEKFEKINSFQRDLKLKSHTVETMINDIQSLKKSKEEIENKSREIEKNATIGKMFFENQISSLKKQIEHLNKENADYKKDVITLKGEVREFQKYTSMAKVNTDHLDKKEFSILEVMSNQVQVFQSENENLKHENQGLSKDNADLMKKVTPLEKLVLHYMKKDNDNDEENSISNVNDIPPEEMQEIDSMKNKSKELFDFCIKLKNENWQLQEQIQQITIECNQRLRTINATNKK